MLRSSLEITKLQGQASACRSALWLFFLLAFGFDEFEFGLLRYAGLEAPSAARFVHIGSAHDDQVIRPRSEGTRRSSDLFFLLAFGFDEFEFGLLRYAGLEAPSAARFVHIGSAHDDQVIRP